MPVEMRMRWGTFLADPGVVTVILREFVPIDLGDIPPFIESGYQYFFRLTPGDSLAVTQRDPDGSAATRFFEVKEGGRVTERVAPHGEYAPP